MIRFCIGFLLVFGAVGGMDNPDQADYFLEQIIAAIIGLGLMAWAVPKLSQEDNRG